MGEKIGIVCEPERVEWCRSACKTRVCVCVSVCVGSGSMIRRCLPGGCSTVCVSGFARPSQSSNAVCVGVGLPRYARGIVRSRSNGSVSCAGAELLGYNRISAHSRQKLN